ncbi:MAG: hypothetical protein Q4D45_04165 [Lachnospiraceae bacterium]|nr:hypothetical protein [Lachnospiraceae bacterium]
MKISTMIIGMLLFAVATMIIYGWGLVKQKNQSRDLMNMLFAKGESKVKKYLKKHDSITRAQVETLCEGIEAKLPFSSSKAVVQNKKDFAEQLLTYMTKTGQLEKDGLKYKKIKK